MEINQLRRNVSSQIYIRRNNMGLSQKQLAKLVGVSVVQIVNWENRKFMPKAFTLCNLADVFCCTVDELLGRTDDDKRRV